MAANDDMLKSAKESVGPRDEVMITKERYIALCYKTKIDHLTPCEHMDKCSTVIEKRIINEHIDAELMVPFIKSGGIQFKYDDGSIVNVEIGEYGNAPTFYREFRCGVKYSDWVFYIMISRKMVEMKESPLKRVSEVGTICGVHKGKIYEFYIFDTVEKDCRNEYFNFLRDNIIIHLK